MKEVKTKKALINISDNHKLKDITEHLLRYNIEISFTDNLSEIDFAIIILQASDDIDINNVSIIRYAAKHYQEITIITDISDCAEFINCLDKNNGLTTIEFRQKMAAKAFLATAYYDALIYNSLIEQSKLSNEFFDKKVIPLNKISNLQPEAAIYANPFDQGIANAKVIQGKKLSYDNYYNADIAFKMIVGFEQPAVSIIKNTNLSGLAIGTTIIEAWSNALHSDYINSYNSTVAINTEVDHLLALHLKEMDLELVIAPKFTSDALIILGAQEKSVLLEYPHAVTCKQSIQHISGGFLFQASNKKINKDSLKCITHNFPNEYEYKHILFATKAIQSIKPHSSIVIHNFGTIGIGASQTNILDSITIAISKAKNKHDYTKIADNCIIATDITLSIDSINYIKDSGIKTIVYLGIWHEDYTIIDQANKYGMKIIIL